MKTIEERAKEYSNYLCDEIAFIAGAESERKELGKIYFEDIKQLCDRWKASDKKIDALHHKEVSELQAEITAVQAENKELRDKIEQFSQWHDPNDPPKDSKDILIKHIYGTSTRYAVGNYIAGIYSSPVVWLDKNNILGWREIHE